ncbi:MAG: hypothetical protein ACJAVI_004034 [Candidatus Azotimanducaceae bacterium]|jgi:uncharacterized protein with NRDE domain
MCLILFTVNPNSDLHLVVAANRDEMHSRPTATANYWDSHPDLLAGRDLQAGGTWLGITNSGRFAAVTNFAETPPDPIPPRSRGDLTSKFLKGKQSCEDYLLDIHQKANEYRGFNLIISDGNEVYYYGNRDQNITKLETGYYGLSNQLLDCNWPKVNSARADLKTTASDDFQHQDLFDLLGNKGTDEPHSARFILGQEYGTRASTVVKMHSNGFHFEERCFAPNGQQKSAEFFEN